MLEISSAVKILNWVQKIFGMYLLISSPLEEFQSSRPKTEVAIFVICKAEIRSFDQDLVLKT